ncbi:MAG: nuclear transport factor 2 family protein [Halioglobus sp.]
MDDGRQIENLIYTYAERIDAGDLEGVADMFRDAEIVSTVHNVRRVGFHEVLQMYRLSCRLYPSTGTPLTKHLTTNVIIELEDSGVEACARSYYTVLQATESLPLQPIISGRYKDRFRKVATQWQFASREMIVDLVGDCSAHLLYSSNGLN